jgi:hypothetical protein
LTSKNRFRTTPDWFSDMKKAVRKNPGADALGEGDRTRAIFCERRTLGKRIH